MLVAGIMLQQENAGIGKIVDVEKFPTRTSASPADHLTVATQLRFVEPAKHARDYVAEVWMEVVVRTIKIGRHHADEVGAVLLPIGLAEFYARNLRDRVPFTG